MDLAPRWYSLQGQPSNPCSLPNTWHECQRSWPATTLGLPRLPCTPSPSSSSKNYTSSPQLSSPHAWAIGPSQKLINSLPGLVPHQACNGAPSCTPRMGNSLKICFGRVTGRLITLPTVPVVVSNTKARPWNIFGRRRRIRW